MSAVRGWHGQGPSKPADAKDGGTWLLPRTALLIRGSKPDPPRVRTGAPDHQSQGRRGHAHSSLSSSPPARGCPTCRVREPARAAIRGDPTEGELPRPRSIANGTEPHLVNPRKHLRSLTLSNGAWASTRTTHYQLNEESAIRDPIDGGCGNLTLRPAEGRRGRVKSHSESSP
jgi:hypothetical protein